MELWKLIKSQNFEKPSLSGILENVNSENSIFLLADGTFLTRILPIMPEFTLNNCSQSGFFSKQLKGGESAPTTATTQNVRNQSTKRSWLHNTHTRLCTFLVPCDCPEAKQNGTRVWTSRSFKHSNARLVGTRATCCEVRAWAHLYH